MKNQKVARGWIIAIMLSAITLVPCFYFALQKLTVSAAQEDGPVTLDSVSLELREQAMNELWGGTDKTERLANVTITNYSEGDAECTGVLLVVANPYGEGYLAVVPEGWYDFRDYILYVPVQNEDHIEMQRYGIKKLSIRSHKTTGVIRLTFKEMVPLSPIMPNTTPSNNAAQPNQTQTL